MTETSTTPTPEEVAAARLIVAEADRKVAKEAQAKREAYMQPLMTLLSSDGFRCTLNALNDMRTNYEDEVAP